MSKLILFEDCPDIVDYDDQDLLVALTPQACHLLSRMKIPYHLTSEFASESELEKLEDNYWEKQLAWFDQFDDLLWQELPELKDAGIRPACLYGYFLKICLDNLFIRGFEIASLLQRPYRRVILWRQDASEPLLDPTLFYRGPSVYSRLLPLFCRKLRIHYQESFTSSSDTLQSQRRIAPILGFPVPRLLLYRFTSMLINGLQINSKTLRTVIPTRQHSSVSCRPLTLLFLKSGYDMKHLLKDAKNNGHRCLVRQGNEVVDVTGFFRKRIARLDSGVPTDKVPEMNLMRSRYEKVANVISEPEHNLWQWPDGWHNVPMSQILAPRLKYWLTGALPVLVNQAHEWLRIFKQERIDFVVTPTLWDLADFSAITASQMTDFTERVHIEHGDSPLALKTWDLLNLFHFDHYFAPHHEVGEYFRERQTCYARPTAKVHVGSYRWHANAGLSRRPRIYFERSGHSVRLNMGSPPSKIPCSRPIVVYLVTATGWDTRYLNSSLYPDTWYYHLQARIVESFAGKDQYTFVVKLLPGDAKFSNPVVDFVRDLAAENIHTSRAPFVQWLPWADRVIIDFPSTGLYEAALAGVPFHLLLHESFKVRRGALEKLRPWTTVFTDPEEAVQAIDAFLLAKVNRETVMHPEGDDILTTLESIRGEKHKVPSKTIEFP